ncbi:MAG: hypothetical protein CL878_15780 [Dehalococcoidia bacterium]|nr:hypothetical protein [Dehalococcoidia bacterium]
MQESAVLEATRTPQDVPNRRSNGWSVRKETETLVTPHSEAVQARTGLHRLMTCVVEPRQVPWLRKLAGGDDSKLGAALATAIGRGLKVLRKKAPQDVIAAATKQRDRVLGSRMVACSLSPEVVKELEVLAAAVEGDAVSVRSLSVHALRVEYLAKHPKQPEVELPPPPSPLAAIFRPAPPPPPPALPQPARRGVARSLGGSSSLLPPGTVPAQLRAALANGSQNDRAGFVRVPARHRIRTSGPPPLTPEDEAELAKGPLFTTAEIRAKREELGLSQARLARALGVSRGLVAEAERGRRAGERTLQRLTAGLRRLLRQEADKSRGNRNRSEESTDSPTQTPVALAS